jgi:hypothetical protein
VGGGFGGLFGGLGRHKDYFILLMQRKLRAPVVSIRAGETVAIPAFAAV